MALVSVFVGSEMVQLKAEREAAIAAIHEMGFRTVTFEEEAGVDSPVRESLQLVARSDICIFLLWQQHSETTFKEFHHANTLQRDILILVKGDEHEPRDKRVRGLVETAKQLYTYKRFNTLADLKNVIRSGLQQIVHTAFSRTVQSLPDDTLHCKLLEAVESARCLAMLCRTPVLLLGPRPYLSQTPKIQHELDAHRAQQQAAEEALAHKREFQIVFSARALLDEIESFQGDRGALAEQVLGRIERLLSSNHKSPLLACTPPNEEFPMFLTYLVTDDAVALLMKSQGNERHCIFTPRRATFAASFIDLTRAYAEACSRRNSMGALHGQLQLFAK